MWPDYIAAITGAAGRGWGYPASEIPFVLIPFIAWLGSTRRFQEAAVTRPERGEMIRQRSAPASPAT
jgi:hypothetical protein